MFSIKTFQLFHVVAESTCLTMDRSSFGRENAYIVVSSSHTRSVLLRFWPICWHRFDCNIYLFTFLFYFLYSTCQQVVSFNALGSLENQSSGIGESLERVIIYFKLYSLFKLISKPFFKIDCILAHCGHLCFRICYQKFVKKESRIF